MSSSPRICTVEHPSLLDDASRRWVRELRSPGPAGEAAASRLHGLLLKAARFEIARRAPAVPQLSATELDDLAHQAAGDAAMSILRRLDDFRGESRFTTWAYKFALLEASVKVRRKAWGDRELAFEPETWGWFEDPAAGPEERAERTLLLAAIQEGIAVALTSRQRQVLIALALNGVPIDVLAERLGSNRNALYKSLHDARWKLRAHLESAGFSGGWQ